MNRDNFITHQNIEHYRQLLKTTKDETERNMIFKLLAEEEMTQLQQGSQNEYRLRELPAITSAKGMTATSVPFRK
jgi:hypothetical protein